MAETFTPTTQSYFQDNRIMKRILTLTLTALTVLCSCNKELEFSESNALTLSLNVGEMATKATEPGVDNLNENLLNSADIFLYQSTSSETETAKVHRRLNLDGSQNQVIVQLNQSELTGLGYSNGSAATYGVFVIANLPSEVAINGNESISGLKAMAIPAGSFLSNQDANQKQDMFVMAGHGSATGGSGMNGFTSSVDLKRIVSKIGLVVKVEDSYEGKIGGVDGTWTPLRDQMKVKFYGAATTGKLGGAYMDQDSDFTTERTGTVDGYKLTSFEIPYYTYPTKVTLEQQPYFVLTLPWSKDGGATSTDTYYKVLCNNEQFDANMYYRFDLDITLAGSTEEPKPIEVKKDNFGYKISEWQSGFVESNGVFQTDAVIKEVRYLVTYNQNQYVMENVNSIDIPFTTSHPCEVVKVSAEWIDYSAASSSTKDISTIPSNKTWNATMSDDGTYFTVSHDLINDYTKHNNFDVSPITFKVKLKHKNDDNYSETITIVQNPAITIRAVDNAQGGTNNNRFINAKIGTGTTGSNGVPTTLGGAYGVGDQTTNMFIISISALPEDSPYVIGDPREYTTSSWTSLGNTVTLANGQDLYKGGTKNTLDYYYKTREDGSADNVIAPSFITASAWSRCSSYDNSMEVVRKRAAVYQENGRPAGRWRLMTKAEAEIVAKLNSTGKIPDLFSNSNNFLFARGYIKNGETNYARFNTEGSVRLVYDEWYWTQVEEQYRTCAPTTFTWGDMPR